MRAAKNIPVDQNKGGSKVLFVWFPKTSRITFTNDEYKITTTGTFYFDVPTSDK